jgi:hypothetical protein
LKSEFKILIHWLIISACAGIGPINAQILQDTAALKLIKSGVDSIYNSQFNYAEEVCRKITLSYPGNPVVVMFKGIMIYWENYPLISDSPASKTFEEEMKRCIRICEKHTNPSEEAEFLLANLCARGLLMTFYSDNELRNEVFLITKSTYHYIRGSFDFTSSYPDFLFFTGIYNYYREVYPRVHPVYKPLAFLFPKGSREKGLEDIETAARYSILMKAESFSDLSYINITYENNYQQALYFSKYLYDLYPHNPQYPAEYIKNLLLLKKYDEAENLVIYLSVSERNSYFQSQLSVFKGIIQEKKYHNNNLAQIYYHTAIRQLSKFDAYGNEFTAYAYFGLSRIAESQGDMEHKRIYRKNANKLVDLKKVNFD